MVTGGDSLECRNCPYGKEDFDRRMGWYNKIVEERGIPNDIYGYLEPQDAADEFEQFVWCNKVGGKTYCFGCCEYACIDIPKHENRAKRKRRSKRERDLKYKNYLKEMYKKNPNYPISYNDEIWLFENHKVEIIKNPKPYYKRVYRGKRSKYLKRQSNKKIRRYKSELSSGRNCYKIFDFWYELY